MEGERSEDAGEGGGISAQAQTSLSAVYAVKLEYNSQTQGIEPLTLFQ